VPALYARLCMCAMCNHCVCLAALRKTIAEVSDSITAGLKRCEDMRAEAAAAQVRLTVYSLSASMELLRVQRGNAAYIV
jgi:hypothetical protein